MSYARKIQYADSANIDAFGRLRTSYPYTVFDSKQIVNNQPLFWDDQQTSGGGTNSTYNTNQASTTISVTAATAGVRVRQTFRWFNYQPAKSQLLYMSMNWGLPATGIKRKAGIFNSQNGLFFDQQADGMGVTIRTYTSGVAVDDRILQENWLLDKLDGSGPSGIDLQYDKVQGIVIDFEWLGIGRVRFGWLLDGEIIYCHEINNANEIDLVYMGSPNLPIRYEIENTGAGGNADFTHICTSLSSEGGIQENGFPFGITRGATSLTTNNNSSIYPLIAFRLRSGYFSSSIQLLDFSIVCTSTAAFNYYLILNPTVTGTAFSYTTLTNSSLEYDVSRTNATTISGGTTLLCGTDSQNNNTSGISALLNSKYTMGSTIAGVSDVIALGVQRVTGTTETFFGSINIRDLQ